mgnify:CR=1 FL=1
MKKTISIITSLFLLMTFSAKAAEWGVGVSGALHMLEADGTETARDSGERNTGSHSEDVQVPELFIEKIADNGLAIGLSYVPARDVGSKSRSDTNSEGDTGSYKADAELDNVFQVYTDIPMGDAGVYLKLGIQHVTLVTLESLNSGSTYPDEDLMGYTAGLGYKADLPVSNTYYKAEVTYTDFDTYEKTSNGNKVVADLDAVTARLSVGYNF